MAMLDYSYYRQLWAKAVWQNSSQLVECSPLVQQWLNESRSLTQKLRQYYPALQVKVLQEKWLTAEQLTTHLPTKNSHQETALFSLQAPCWLREVVLHQGQQPLVFAQTFIPQTSFQQYASIFTHLNSQPIGEWLFQQQVERIALQSTKVEHCYARRSKLLVNGYPLIIGELFVENFFTELCK